MQTSHESPLFYRFAYRYPRWLRSHNLQPLSTAPTRDKRIDVNSAMAMEKEIVRTVQQPELRCNIQNVSAEYFSSRIRLMLWRNLN
ncbi:unnamed protein product [Schistosoma intercalatum]|nr:unnamed protein product [Schistosoma intercalatum]